MLKIDDNIPASAIDIIFTTLTSHNPSTCLVSRRFATDHGEGYAKTVEPSLVPLRANRRKFNLPHDPLRSAWVQGRSFYCFLHKIKTKQLEYFPYLCSPEPFVHIVVVVAAHPVPAVSRWTMHHVRRSVRYPTLPEELNGEVLLVSFLGSFIAHLNCKEWSNYCYNVSVLNILNRFLLYKY